jgi:predicted alpha-1,2-mannosidase
MNNLRKKVLMMTMAAATLSAIAQQPVDYVNPIIGTNGMGHTFPGACTPFGWVQLSPDTDTIPHNVNGAYQKNAYEYCAGYQYRDKTIVGFSHTHLSGTGHSDLGDILLMPAVGDVKLNPGRADYPEEGYRSRFDHATEKAVPGYYEVMLDDYGIKAQLTATQRTGIHKYTFPKGKDGHLILDLVHGIYNYDGKVLWANLRVENDTLLTGYRITNGWARTNYTYFAISLSQPIKDYGYKDKEKVLYNGFWRRFKLEKNFPEITGRKIVAYFNFDTANNSELVVKVALSAVSTEGAIKNLRAEASGKSFEQLAEAARTDWNSELEHFEIEGTPDQKAMFYTSLYHTMINPSVYMDVDGSYRGLDHNIHRAEGFTNYTIFSLWDTYRAEHPFLNLVKPGRNADMVESMIKHEQQSVHGMLPIWSLMGNENWCMSGYHAVSVLADAITKGVFSNVDEAWLAMVGKERIEETIDPEQAIDRALDTYLKKGYSEEWIHQRLLAIRIRNELTDEWKKRGVQKGKEYAILTDEISRAWSGMTTGQYKRLKGLTKENLRDNMTDLELVLTMLAEASTTDISKTAKPQTFEENKQVAKRGGKVAGIARQALEAETGKPVITEKNAFDFQQLVTDIVEDAAELPEQSAEKKDEE